MGALFVRCASYGIGWPDILVIVVYPVFIYLKALDTPVGHMWESQVLLTDGQVVFPRVLRFLPTFDERSARYKWIIPERAVNPK